MKSLGTIPIKTSRTAQVAGAAFQVRAVTLKYDGPREPHPHQVQFYTPGKMPATCFEENSWLPNNQKIRLALVDINI
ncbi:hypothetical protein AU255_17405 [Methyloprofundus sedimenti]|uniref:Uncharacterized protein n=1 Tax=Methyloprofundus sedimenti TaxID=1420851 RepID=A0A1V8M108_9GAMM|nr:hypothetical protein AU255_17405 [Methyloprofundus sedimenti]